MFQAEAVNTSVYLLNMLSTKALKGKTPYEAWHGVKPSIEHLKIFGYVCVMLLFQKIKKDKLDQKAKVGIFVGCNCNSKGYRIYNLITKNILINRNMKFDEFSKWNWKFSKVKASCKS